MTIFGDYLKEIRGNRSLREMEKITGLSHTYLSTLEKGYDPRSGKKRNPTPEVIKRLAETLDENYFELMQLAGYMESSDLNDLYQKRQELENAFEKKKKEASLLFDERGLIQDKISNLIGKLESVTDEDVKKDIENKIKSLRIKLKLSENAPSKFMDESDSYNEELRQINELIRIALEVKDFSNKRRKAVSDKKEIHLEDILSSPSPVYFNNSELNEHEKEKVLQLLKLTLDK